MGDFLELPQNNTVKKQRESNFELLRIVCMALIVLHHLSVHGNIVLESITKVNGLFLTVFSSVGKLAVNVYVLISGYFLINSKFKFSKLLDLVFQTVFF